MSLDSAVAPLPAWFSLLPPRLQLSFAKHRSLAGHARLARRIARWVPGYRLDDDRFFAVDGASPAVAERRRAAFYQLAQRLRGAAPEGLALTAATREGLSDLQFTGRYRVPFPFSERVREHLAVPAFWSCSAGVRLTDLDGREFLDLTGSYGVNVFGLDFYKATMREGAALGETLGPVLGGYHPCVADNVTRLKALSGQDEVSFHMSGTEAVMQAVRLARYHTGRRKLVRFCGAYHGWWDDVQPGPGNPTTVADTFTLRDLDERSLHVLRRRRDIACVLVNPLQALHPNRSAPGDSSLVLGRESRPVDPEAYGDWLRRLRAVCDETGIALILDEVFVGFRLARGGAQERFGVRADLVTYGKTLGGGLPVGVVCGRAGWMRRFRPERPADICFARGTFNAHPYVMGAMNAFLRSLDEEPVKRLYDGLDARWNTHLAGFNDALQAQGLPVRVAGLGSIWTVNFTQPSRYHWMLQYYLRDAGLALSWVGTGRLVFSLNYRDEDVAEVAQRFVDAACRMREDGWWDASQDARGLRRGLLRELLAAARSRRSA